MISHGITHEEMIAFLQSGFYLIEVDFHEKRKMRNKLNFASHVPVCAMMPDK